MGTASLLLKKIAQLLFNNNNNNKPIKVIELVWHCSDDKEIDLSFRANSNKSFRIRPTVTDQTF